MEIPVFIDGHRAKVVLAKASRSVRTMMGSVRMVFIGPRYTWVKAGQILAHNGLCLLLANHHQAVRQRGMLGFEVTRRVDAVQTVTETHPVTGMEGHRIEKPAVRIMMAEYQAENDNELGFEVGLSLLVTGTPINKDWKLDGKRVHKVTPKMGLYFVEVRQ